MPCRFREALACDSKVEGTLFLYISGNGHLNQFDSWYRLEVLLRKKRDCDYPSVLGNWCY